MQQITHRLRKEYLRNTLQNPVKDTEKNIFFLQNELPFLKITVCDEIHWPDACT